MSTWRSRASTLPDTLWGVSECVRRGRWSSKRWLEWAAEEELEGYDFDSVRMGPILVSAHTPSHLHIWDGWHRSLIHVASKTAEVEAIVGLPKLGVRGLEPRCP